MQRQWSGHVGRDALVGEIKEEGAAPGRSRGTFAGKGIAPQRPTTAPHLDLPSLRFSRLAGVATARSA